MPPARVQERRAHVQLRRTSVQTCRACVETCRARVQERRARVETRRARVPTPRARVQMPRARVQLRRAHVTTPCTCVLVRRATVPACRACVPQGRARLSLSPFTAIFAGAGRPSRRLFHRPRTSRLRWRGQFRPTPCRDASARPSEALRGRRFAWLPRVPDASRRACRG
jgi:hypothetical protein